MNIEGIRIYNPVIVGSNYGIKYETPNNISVDLQVHGGHINSKFCGIVLNNVQQFSINGVNFYKNSPSYPYVAVYVGVSCRDGGVRDCKFIDTSYSSMFDRAIYMAGKRCVVSGNSFDHFDEAVLLTYQSGWCSLASNIFFDNTASIEDAGTTNIIDDSNILNAGN